MRLGLFDNFQVDPTDPTDDATFYARRLADLALADGLGFDLACTAERHFLAQYRCPAPGAWLGAASQRTTRMRLGVLAYTLPLHPPAALAEEVAVLDQLTGGRLEVGLGLGHRPEELAAVGIDPAERAASYRERLAVLRALWSGGRVTLETPRTTVHEVAIHPLPAQQPHPPLWYPGTDPVVAGWAGSQGMGLAVGFASTDRLLPSAVAHAAGVRRAAGGEEPAAPVPGVALMRHVYLAEDDARARAEMVEDLLRLRAAVRPDEGDEGGRSDRRAEAEAGIAAMVRDEQVIAGGPETVADGIARACGALGATTFLANPYVAGIDEGRVHRALRLLAGEVRTRVSAAVGAGAGRGDAVAV